MAKNPAFPFYANDYLVDTLRWSRGMKSLHIDLLAESWSNKEIKDEGGFPSGLSEEDRNLWVKIQHKWVLQDGIWFNPKLEELRAEKKRFSERQAENGSKGGRPKKEKPTDNPRVYETITQNKAIQNPLEGEEEDEEVLIEMEHEKNLERWTLQAIDNSDFQLEQMEAGDARTSGVPWPAGFDRKKAILDHQDLARRYSWTFETQQKFRHSLMKVLRDAKTAIKSQTKAPHSKFEENKMKLKNA